jgi:hypothetical protein
MAERIPQSLSYLVVFRAFLASDGKTPATGKTIAVTISKNGGAFGNPNAGATNATEISSGFYKFTLDTTDTGTLGPLAWRGAEGTINDAGDVLTVAKATNAGFSALPDVASGSAGAVPTTGAGANQIDVTSGKVKPADGSIVAATFAAGAVDANAIATDALGALELSAGAASEVAAAVWDLVTAGHTTSGTFGAAMVAAGSAGDPWATTLPGSYGAGTAGNILGNRLDAAVSTRLASSGYTAPDNATIAAIATYVDTEVAAIKAKTDNLPASPAAVGSAMTLASNALTTAAIQDGAITSAKFTVGAISGPASGILEQVRQLWRRFFKDSAKDATAGTITTFADNGTTPVTTQNFTDDGVGNETLGAAS